MDKYKIICTESMQWYKNRCRRVCLGRWETLVPGEGIHVTDVRSQPAPGDVWRGSDFPGSPARMCASGRGSRVRACHSGQEFGLPPALQVLRVSQPWRGSAWT
jgi:hypothetical protein